ncbi:hypothetical protein PCYB_006470 [Plasmodium cynomolgi strain B]|uniref:CYIR protein n=1 Tax=Plasmodium cynomolgi (strain B) TaxID=1120755 RepID=K6UNX7_PLACD|nr:hypothetical protein PCYB_006470 [Plasmodium cynomolgi strain B]GAB69898.1 hypothetical protein PCYB_006470 [Plasmodium cynomolgi strain B]
MPLVEVYTHAENTELNNERCVELYFEIKDELEKIFKKFQGTGDADIRTKCDVLDNNINKQKEKYQKCEKYYVSNDSINIGNDINNLSNEYNKYTKCSSESTFNDKGDDKSKPKTKELCNEQVECAKEQDLQDEKITKLNCKKELSESDSLQQEEYLEQNDNHSAVSDNKTAEQKTTFASTASTLDDSVEPNCPSYHYSDIEVFPSPNSSSQAKLSLSSDVESNILSFDLYNDNKYIIVVVDLPMAILAMILQLNFLKTLQQNLNMEVKFKNQLIKELLKVFLPLEILELLIILRGLRSLKISIITTLLYNMYHLHQRYP